MHSEYKSFCLLKKTEEKRREWARQGKEVEKQSKLCCLFPQSASDSSVRVTAPLSLSLPLSPSLIASLQAKGREDVREGKGGEEEASFHSDGWWKRTRQVLLGCTPLLFLSPLSPPFLSVCFSLKHPCFHSLFFKTFLCSRFKSSNYPSLNLPRFLFSHYQDIHSSLSNFSVSSSYFCTCLCQT